MEELVKGNLVEGEGLEVCEMKLGRQFEDLDDDDDEVGPSHGHGGIFAGFEQGLATIRRHARETLRNCSDEESWMDMKNRLESSTLGLLRAEKCALAMSRLVAETVDQYLLLDDDEAEGDGPLRPFCLGDQDSKEIRGMVDEMNKVLSEKMTEFKVGQSEKVLSADLNFLALKKEINLAESDLKEQGDGHLFQTKIQGQEDPADSDDQDKDKCKNDHN